MSVLAASFDFGAPLYWVHTIWLIVVVVVLAIHALWLRRRTLRLFGAAPSASIERRRNWQLALTTLAMLSMTFALLQPHVDPRPVAGTRALRDVVVCLDVSRSMLADDLKPNRLERAKLEVARLADHMGGDRIGLIAFAGDASVLCPLTSTTSFFKSALKRCGPASAGHGGTRIGDAIRTALTEVLGLELTRTVDTDDAQTNTADTASPSRPSEQREQQRKPAAEEQPSYADILIITDGEDHDSYPTHAARTADSLGVGVFAIGLGSLEGATVPDDRPGVASGAVMTYKGETVRSKLQGSTLTDMVSAISRGGYLPAATHHFDLTDFYAELMRKGDRRLVSDERIEWTEIYQPFCLLAMALLALAWLIPLRAKRITVAALALLATLAGSTPSFADSAPEASPQSTSATAAIPADPLLAYNEGTRALQAGGQVFALLEHAAMLGTGAIRDNAHFNLGVAWHRDGLSALSKAGSTSAPSSTPASEADPSAILRTAIDHLRRAIAFYRQVPPAGDRDTALASAKSALVVAVERITALERNKREADNAALLSDPGKLLAVLSTRVRSRRRDAQALAHVSLRGRRRPLRALAKAHAGDRSLLEQLAVSLAQPPPDPTASAEQAQADETPEHKAQRDAFKALIDQATVAARAVEAALVSVDGVEAVTQSAQLMEALTRGRFLQPMDLGTIAHELVGEQSTTLSRIEQGRALAEEEIELAALCTAVAMADTVTPTATPGQPTAPPVDTEQIAELGRSAQANLIVAFRALETGDHTAALPTAQEALADLQRIVELLPKPPESPADKLKRLIRQQTALRDDVAEAPLSEEATERNQALYAKEQAMAEEASALAGELALSPPEQPGAEAAKHVQTGSEAMAATAQAIDQTHSEAAVENAARAIDELKRALALLQGDQNDQEQDKQDKQTQQGEDDKNKGEQQDQMTPQQARNAMEQMDRERREAEEQLLPGARGIIIERDW